MCSVVFFLFFLFKQKTAYEMRISDWSSDVCSSDLGRWRGRHDQKGTMTDRSSTQAYLTGQLLIAMPTMADPRFARAVIYLCAHSDEGAMGLVVNKAMPSITFPDLLEQLGISGGQDLGALRVHFGGPAESGRGFVLQDRKSGVE